MTEKDERSELTDEELDELEGEPLPDREAMSVIDGNRIVPIPGLPVEPPAIE